MSTFEVPVPEPNQVLIVVSGEGKWAGVTVDRDNFADDSAIQFVLKALDKTLE